MTRAGSHQTRVGTLASLTARRADRQRAATNSRAPASTISDPTADEAKAPFDPERLRDAAFIGELLDIPAKTVLQYARDGRMPCVRIGKHVRFRVSDIEAALRSGNQR